MPDRIYGNEYRTTLVCVDSWKGGESSGRLYNPYWGEGESFEGLMDFLKKMEALLDQMQLPQSFTAKRSFGPPPGTEQTPQPMLKRRRRGEEATFSIRVLFRQNASWQGSVIWEESGREESFRSVLELPLLMDSAVLREQEKREKAGTCFSVLHGKTE